MNGRHPARLEARRGGPAVQPANEAQFRAWTSGGMPEPAAIGAGSWAIAIPIPASRIRYVYAHVLVGDAGLTVIDPGWDSPAAWAALEHGLGRIGARTSDVASILVSHGHPDHHGLTERLRAASGGWVGMHGADSPRPGHADQDARARADLLRGMGLTSRGEPARPDGDRPQAVPDRWLADGDLLRAGDRLLRVIATPGHTQGHLSFLDENERILFAGDHLLPTVNPNVWATSPGPDDPVADYLRSLDRIARLDVDYVACAHQYHFRGAGERSRALSAHHSDRLDLLLDAVGRAQDRTCWQLTQLLPWSTPFTDMSHRVQRYAARATMAHLIHLERSGRVVRAGTGAGIDAGTGAGIDADPARWRLA
jgi:glyoxylase-like metal-dependent hydrolase (beta-lactamase superfamily II)